MNQPPNNACIARVSTKSSVLSILQYFKSLFILKSYRPFEMRRSASPPPRDISEVVSCVDVWWVGEGSKGCFYLIIIFLSGSLRSPIFNICQYSKCFKNPNHFKVQRVISSPTSSYTRSLAFIHWFHRSAFRCLFRLKLHDFTPLKPNIFLVRTPDTHYDITNTYYNAKAIMLNVLLCAKKKNTPREVIFMKVTVLKWLIRFCFTNAE